VAPVTACTCHENTNGVYLCHACDQTLAYALLAVADFHEELGTIRAKMTRFGNGSTKGSVGKVVPAPIDWLHIDLFAWNTEARPGRPVGGEAQTLRTLLAHLEGRFGVV
jgi:hypothetical protein